MSSGGENARQVEPPINAKKLDQPGRHCDLPVIYVLEEHPLVPKPHGTIYLGIVDMGEEAMQRRLRVAANMSLPTNQKEREESCFVDLRPSRNDYYLERNLYGTGRLEDDTIKSWSLSKDEQSAEDIKDAERIREIILGPEALMTPEKAVRAKDGSYTGGIQFERSDRAINIKSGPRCYQLASTVQAQRSLSAPGVQGKVHERTKDQDAQMRFDLLQSGATSALQGLKKGPRNLLPALEQQAEVTALPRIGHDKNVAWPGWQLNCAAAVIRLIDEILDLRRSLGKFAGPHIDVADNPVAPTAMKILSKPHPDIEPEYFYVMDSGICWLMEEFSVLYFSGLHFHGGHQPMYREERTKDEIYYRLTLIAYPPSQMLNGEDAVALVADAKGEPFTVGIEMRNPRSHQLSQTGMCSQATWAADGASMLTPKGHINHFSRLLLQAITFFARQLPPDMVPRVDKSLAMKMVSVVIDNKRTTADEWDMGPGWIGDDVEIGKDYTNILAGLGVESINDLSPPQLALLCNSDAMKEAPYGNIRLQAASNTWADRLRISRKEIPVCVTAAGPQDESILGGRLVIGAITQARNEELDQRPAKKQRVGDLPPPNSLIKAHYTNESGESEMEDSDTNIPYKEPSKQNHNSNITDSDISGKFIEAISSDSLKCTLESIKGITKQPQLSKLHNLDRIVQILDQSVLDSNIRTIWPTWQAYANRKNMHSIELWFMQKQLLIANMHIWKWLRDLLDKAYEYEQHDPSSGVGNLVAFIKTYMETKSAASVSIDASKYLPSFLPGESVFQFKIGNRNKYFDSKEQILNIVEDILCTWLGFPDKTYQIKAWMTEEITSHIPEGVLVLNDVWRALGNVNVHILGCGKNVRTTRREMKVWCAKKLSRHPLSLEDSEEVKILASINETINTLLLSAPVDSTRPEDLMDIDNSSDVEMRPVENGMHTNSGPPQPDIANNSPSTVPNTEEFRRFVLQIQLLYPLLNNPTAPIKIPPRQTQPGAHYIALYQEKVQQMGDKKLPFRDVAPSRRKILQPGGPFCAENLCTRQGLFSAIIYRGITHNTDFLLDHPKTIFQDLDDWDSVYLPLKSVKKKDYFCNTSAYGRATGSRTVDNVGPYWDATASTQFSAFINGRHRFDFKTAFNLFKTLPAFGSLTAYLLTADYATAGKVKMPSLDDMGYVMKVIDGGGVAGLKRLGFTVKTKEQITAAFYTVHKNLEQRIPADCRKQTDFSFFFTEHALCKLKRLDILEFRQACGKDRK